GHLAHAELKERVTPDRAQGAHVGIALAIKQPDQRADGAASDKLMPAHAAGLALAAGARGDDEVASPLLDRRDQHSDRCGIVGAVAVPEHENISIGGLRAGETSESIAAADRDHLRARRARARARAVAAAAIGDDDAIDNITRQAS